MSFTVKLWSFNKKFNSTDQPSNDNATSYDCIVKDGTKINRPIIELNLGFTSDPSTYNYAQISAFDRYYFIDEWSFSNGLWTASMHTDVLATFKTQIGNSTLYVLRAAGASDGRIVDNLYPCKVNCDYASSVLTYPYSDGCYVVGCISKYGGIGSLTYYVLDQTNLTNLVKALIEDVVDQQNGFELSDASYALQQSIVDPIQYLKSCILMPFPSSDLLTIPLNVNVEVYGWTFSNVTGKLLAVPRMGKTYTFNTQKHPDTNSRGNYVNTSPYTKATLTFPPFGTIELDTSVICDVSTITAEMTADPSSGDAVLRVIANGILLNEIKAKVGVPIQLAQITRDYLGAAQSAIGGIAGSVSNFLTGNVAGGITSAVSGVGNAIQSLVPRAQTMGSSGSFAEFGHAPRLDFQFFRPVNDDNTHHGRPLCQNKTINTLSGFMLIQDGDIGTVGFVEENQEIKTLLESGFYYE